MSKPRLDQLLAGYADGDAISRQAVILRDVFRRWGYASEIFADPAHVSPTLRADCRPLTDYAGGPSDVALHHYGLASRASEVFTASKARKILIYHNITPPEFFRGFDDALAAQLAAARAQVAEVARRCETAWAVSQFDAEDLAALGAPNARVFPLVFSAAPLELTPDADLTARLTAPLTTLLCVGRLAPNKRIEDLIQAYAFYHFRINPFSRLLLVGSDRSCPRYFTMLKMLVGDLDVPNVCFEGFASPAGLVSYYKLADLFVSCSAHEGYGAPLVEAMFHGVPVIARAAGGTAEALGGAGVLYDDMQPAELAELFHRVASERTMRDQICAAQQRRIRDVLARPVEQELRALLTDFLPS
ncbi:MAG: glycosyltransferase [Verrucomicrobia bacterium]|nr:MAG: glycosyltransferase [Verrucomicrobiota bacterium]